ncbi:MAG TPA: nitroreductase [Desulfobulbaceae bacterium]|nr:nitroreductase [Desulfobulbaceae bacterium]
MLSFHVNQELCIQCGECVRDCPYAVIEMSGGFPAIAVGREERCIRCQHCLAVCSTGALSILGKDPARSIRLAGNLPTAAQMETLIMGRRSVRWYAPEPVESAAIAHLLDVVAHGPTGVNNRQLLFTVIEDQDTMRALRQETLVGIRRAVQEKSLPPGLEFYEAILRAWETGRDIIFRGAPHLLAVSTPRGGPSPEQDTMIALSYFELLACSNGLGTLWDGLAKWALTAILPDMPKKLGIPETHALGYIMLFGKPAVQYYRTVQRGEPQVNRVKW